MNVKYDIATDAVFIELSIGKYESTRKVSDAILIDEDKEGKILGIEILDAKKNIHSFDPQKLTITAV